MKQRKLTEVCNIQYGYPFDSKLFASSPNDGMPLIRIRDVKEGATDTYYTGDYPKEYVVHKGEYLVGMDGEFNIAAWQSGDALLNQRVCKVSSASPEVSEAYVYRFLTKELKKIEADTPFVTVKHLSAKALNKVVIPLPPLPEQESIVKELDLLSGIIEKKKQQLKELDNLAQSIFYEMFGDPIANDKGWEVKKLGDICTISSSKRIFADEYLSEGIPFYRGKEISEKSKGEIPSVELFISQNRYNEIKDKYGVPQIGDILLTAVGTIGNMWVVNDDAPFYYKDGNVVCLHANRDTEPRCFRFLLDLLINDYKKNNANGCAYNALTIVSLKGMPTIIIPLSLQQSFAAKIEAIEKQKGLIKQSIKETETLFNSRMDYYFN